MCRLSWYSEWIDHFECGVRYRTVTPSAPVVADPRLAEHGVHVQRRAEDRQLLAELEPSSRGRGRNAGGRSGCATAWSRSTLMMNGEYRLPPVSDPDHSGEVITLRGRAWVSAKEIRLSSCSAARSASWVPVRRSSARKPSTASRPLVVPDSARIASQACTSRSSRGRPSATPPRTVPFLPSRNSDLGGRLEGDALGGQPQPSRRAGPARPSSRRRSGSRARRRPAWA